MDRGACEALDLRLARRLSETMAYLLTRAIAYALMFEEGIAFSKGELPSPDEPPLSVRDLQGNLRCWIEIGTAGAERLRKATKAGPQVSVFTHHDPRRWQRESASRDIPEVECIEVWPLDPRTIWNDRLLYVRSRVGGRCRQSRIRKEPVMGRSITYVALDAHRATLQVAMLVPGSEAPLERQTANEEVPSAGW